MSSAGKASDAAVRDGRFILCYRRPYQVTSIFVFSVMQCVVLGDAASSSSAVSSSIRGATLLSKGKVQKAEADVYYATRMADRFQSYALKKKLATDSFHSEEQHRLELAISQAIDIKDKELLEDAAVVNEESRMEAQNALNEMMNFVTTLKQAMGARGSTASCLDLSCGTHAYCATTDAEGAQCVCEEGYEGNGFVCNPPKNLNMHALFFFKPNMPPQVADIHVAMFDANRIGVVYRDIRLAHQGYILIGKAGANAIAWDAPTLFSNQSMAFSPVMTALQGSSGLAIAFRDTNMDGNAVLITGSYNASSRAVTFGKGKAFARHQAQGMAILPLSDARVAVMFSEHVLSGAAGKLAGGAMYGSALLAQVYPDSGTEPYFLAKHRFASGPVESISATLLSPMSLVVGFRLGENGQSAQKTEASVIYGQLHGNRLVFDQHPVSLEPQQSQIWARSVAPIDRNTFAYTYHSGNEGLTKQAILRIEPVTHRMLLLQAPRAIGKGFTPYVGSVSAAFLNEAGELTVHQDSGPRLLTIHNRDGTAYAQAHMCKVNAEGLPAGCKDVELGQSGLISVGSAAVGDGRLVIVSTDSKGVPYYKLIGFIEVQ